MKLLDQLLEILSEGEKPNRFTKGMGDLIRKAREEASLSQRKLAELIYRRQAALSEMENGLMQPDAETLLLLSDRLKKPIVYFYPSPWKPDPLGEDLNEKEKELIIQSKRLTKDDVNRIITQIKALADMYNQ